MPSPLYRATDSIDEGRRVPGEPDTKPSVRASTLAAAGIIVVAGLLLGLLALRGWRASQSAAGHATPAAVVIDAATTTARATAMASGASGLSTAVTTTNLYLLPDRTSELVAVLAAGERASLTGRSQDGSWLLVRYPADSPRQGWTRTSSLAVDAETVRALPALPAGTSVAAPDRSPTATSAAAATATATTAPSPLPDLAITEVVLLQGNHLAVGIRNLGQQAIVDATIGVNVTNLEGDLVGVLSVGPASLAVGANATVVTPLVIPRAGSYRVELDPANEVAEIQKLNNIRFALLVPVKG